MEFLLIWLPACDIVEMKKITIQNSFIFENGPIVSRTQIYQSISTAASEWNLCILFLLFLFFPNFFFNNSSANNDKRKRKAWKLHSIHLFYLVGECYSIKSDCKQQVILFLFVHMSQKWYEIILLKFKLIFRALIFLTNLSI